MPEKPDKKESILEAMLDLVAERGFHNAPMSLLSKRSGASTGVIYHYFPSKDDLIHAAYMKVREIKRRVLLEGYAPEMPIKEGFLQVWTNAYHFYHSHSRETSFLAQYETSPYAGCAAPEALDEQLEDEAKSRFERDFRPKSAGGKLKDLPTAAIQELTFGLALRLSKGKETLSADELKLIGEAVWVALAAD